MTFVSEPSSMRDVRDKRPQQRLTSNSRQGLCAEQ
jgi:hypothetical protein